MEETVEKEQPVEVKVPDIDEGGIGRRLRDRDLLRKRKAQAEEKATTQWVYGAQSRKRVRREPSNTPGRKGRPRKTGLAAETQPDRAELPAAPQLIQSDEPIPVPAPHTAYVLPTAPAPAPQLTEPLPAPAPTPAPAPAPEGALEEASSGKTVGEVLIEDLGSDEEEDKPASPEKLIIDQGTVEEAERNKALSDPVLAPPPAPTQQAYLPGNLL